MSYPFPGMNPWLENPELWRNVHLSLINALRDSLAPQLEPRYFVDVETHTYISKAPDEPIHMRYPDVSVVKVGGPAVLAPAMHEAVVPYVVELALPEPYEEPYLAVRLLPDGELVTVIELLSHSNKRAGDERRSYQKKREEFFDSDVHFVEIDLLRAYPPMPFTEHLAGDYRIFIRRVEKGRKALVYAFSVRNPIPTFPLPLLPDDQEPIIDLGALLHDVYDRARYRLVINYNKPPTPTLSEADAAWAADCLAKAAR